VHSIAQTLETVSLFKSLRPCTLQAVAATMEVAWAPTGVPIFRTGDPGDAFFIVVDGWVSIIGPDGETELETYVANTERPWFGELALWTDKPRAATAMPMDFCKLLVVRKPHFAEFLRVCPSFNDTFSTSASAFRSINDMAARSEDTFDINSEARLLALFKTGAHRVLNDQGVNDQAITNWERLVAAVLVAQQASDREDRALQRERTREDRRLAEREGDEAVCHAVASPGGRRPTRRSSDELARKRASVRRASLVPTLPREVRNL